MKKRQHKQRTLKLKRGSLPEDVERELSRIHLSVSPSDAMKKAEAGVEELAKQTGLGVTTTNLLLGGLLSVVLPADSKLSIDDAELSLAELRALGDRMLGRAVKDVIEKEIIEKEMQRQKEMQRHNRVGASLDAAVDAATKKQKETR